MNQQDFGLRLKELRLTHELTQSQLANQIGITRQAYITYETGRCMPSAEIITRLSMFFDTDLMKILYDPQSSSFQDGIKLVENANRDDLFSVLKLYSKLSPTSQKRILNLMNILYKGGDKN